jgi:hypothetical protein
MLAIAAYAIWQTRGRSDLSSYLKGSGDTRWLTIGLSVMATQASAVTFLSTPGQGYESGLGFVQNYFGAPLALIVVAVFFLPIYRRLKVYTAYEYLGLRFDPKTRILGAALFLLQRGLGAGITIYAPAIVLSTVMGWRLDVTIICSGLFVVAYTVAGGCDAVSLTQKYQIGVIFAGMIAAFFVLLSKLPHDLTFRRLHGDRRRLPQARGRGLLAEHGPPVHALVGRPGRHVPRHVLLRHGPVAGAALPRRPLASRGPARPHVQRGLQDPDAVLHPSPRGADLRLLPVRAAAGLLQQVRLELPGGARAGRQAARHRVRVRGGPCRGEGAAAGVAGRASLRKRSRRGLGPRGGRGGP